MKKTAGIICFSVSPTKNTIYLLLGQESDFKIIDQKKGPWCDFGGKMKPTESDEASACREFCEESMCCVQFQKDYIPLQSYPEALLQKLQRKEYYRKICLQTVQNQRRVYYLVYVPWQPEVVKNFQKIRSGFLQSEQASTSNLGFHLRQHPGIRSDGLIDRHYLEKCRIQWWSLERLSGVVRNRGRFRDLRLRAGFLPGLEVCINELKKSQRIQMNQVSRGLSWRVPPKDVR